MSCATSVKNSLALGKVLSDASETNRVMLARLNIAN